jgi:hypothetical protein
MGDVGTVGLGCVKARGGEKVTELWLDVMSCKKIRIINVDGGTTVSVTSVVGDNLLGVT